MFSFISVRVLTGLW